VCTWLGWLGARLQQQPVPCPVHLCMPGSWQQSAAVWLVCSVSRGCVHRAQGRHQAGAMTLAVVALCGGRGVWCCPLPAEQPGDA
jgi:hypothetical protein